MVEESFVRSLMIATWLLKDPAVLRALLPTLARLVNGSLTIGELPACLKVVVVNGRPLFSKNLDWIGTT